MTNESTALAVTERETVISTRRKFLLDAGALGLGALGTAVAPAWAQTGGAPALAKGSTLTVSTWGGVTQDLIKNYAEKEFEKLTGAKLAYDIGGVGARYGKLLAQRNSPPADVFISGDEQVIAGERAGLLQPIDAKKIPGIGNIYDWALIRTGAREKSLMGVGFAVNAYVIGYHPELVKVAPTSWADLWRPEFQGKLALAAPGHSMMPMVMVIAAELAGGSASNIDPGFRKMAELRPNKLTFFWTDWASMNKTGDVAIATEFDYYLQTMKTLKYPIEYIVPKEKGIGTPLTTSVVRGSKLKEPGEALISLLVSPGFQQAAAIHAYLGPTDRTVKLSAETAARCACGATVDRLRFFDPVFVADARPAWTERINTEVIPQWRTR